MAALIGDQIATGGWTARDASLDWSSGEIRVNPLGLLFLRDEPMSVKEELQSDIDDWLADVKLYRG